MTQPSGTQPANQRSSLSAGENATRPGRRLSALRRQQQSVQLKVPASSVEDVVAAIRDRRQQEGRRMTLVLKVAGDGPAASSSAWLGTGSRERAKMASPGTARS